MSEKLRVILEKLDRVGVLGMDDTREMHRLAEMQGLTMPYRH